MGTAETGWFRTESGVVLEMDIPLLESIAQRVKAGEIVRMKRDGDSDRWLPWEEPEVLSGSNMDEDPLVPQAEHEAALARIAELTAELAMVTAERDTLKTTPKKATQKPA